MKKVPQHFPCLRSSWHETDCPDQSGYRHGPLWGPPRRTHPPFGTKDRKMPGLHFEGITTHAGHIYGTANREEQQRIGLEEGRLMVQPAELLRANGIPVSVVSVGSTPSVTISGKVKGVTEIRPGNYVFYDAMQVGLGVATWEQCPSRWSLR